MVERIVVWTTVGAGSPTKVAVPQRFGTRRSRAAIVKQSRNQCLREFNCLIQTIVNNNEL